MAYALKWSKLQKEVYKLTDKSINFQIHCSKYRMNSRYGGTDLPRYFITLDDEIIWDYPKDFIDEFGDIKNLSGKYTHYPYNKYIPAISALIRQYIDTPKSELLITIFENDYWGLINIFKSG